MLQDTVTNRLYHKGQRESKWRLIPQPWLTCAANLATIPPMNGADFIANRRKMKLADHSATKPRFLDLPELNETAYASV